MSFEQDPNEQANISNADLAILVDELKTVKMQREGLRAVLLKLLQEDSVKANLDYDSYGDAMELACGIPGMMDNAVLVDAFREATARIGALVAEGAVIDERLKQRLLSSLGKLQQRMGADTAVVTHGNN